jgi:hypothetical protein
MQQTPLASREAVVAEIARQLANLNVQTQQGGAVTTSQGGYDFTVQHSTAVRRRSFYRLTDEQR